MENNYLGYNINGMNRNQLYQTAKNLATELGYDLTPLRQQWRRSTREYWENEVNAYQRNIRNRTNNYNRALRVSRENREPLQLLNILTGTSNEQWVRELRRLRMRARRNPIAVQAIVEQRRRVAPILQQIVAPVVLRTPEQRRQQERANLFQQELRNNVEARNETARFNTRINGLINANNYQGVLNIVINEEKTLTNAQANRFYNSAVANGRYTLTLISTDGTVKVYALTEASRDFVSHFLTNGLVVDDIPVFGSDAINDFNLTALENVQIDLLVRPARVIPNRDGRFFPHINTTKLDLSKYQIFNQEQAYDKKILEKREHCLIQALIECGVNNATVSEVKMCFTSGLNIKKKDMRKVATIINRIIVLHTMKPDGTINKQICEPTDGLPEDYEETINIALFENHYFIFEKTIYSKFCIDNYENVKDQKDCYNIIRIMNRKPVRKDTAKINSLLMTYKLLNANFFKKLDLVEFEETASHQTLKEHIYLENIENEQKKLEKREKKDIDLPAIYYADCESYVSDITVEHKLQLLGVANSKNDYVRIFNVCDKVFNQSAQSAEQMVVYEFLKNITKNGKQNALCYFHNLKYDYHLLEQYINIKSKCMKDNQIYSVKIIFNKCEVELRDSYKLVPFALSKFQKEFGLPTEFGKKEAIAYIYYTKANNDVRIRTEDYRKLLSFDDQKIFDINMRKEPSYECLDKTFNPMEYYREYLRLDCLVLKKGIEKFNELINEITNGKMSVYDCLTISSLTDKYMIAEGAYEGIYTVKGNLRAYIAKAVYGGRVCANTKYVKQTLEGKFSDYDGVSLYPSAINRLCREIGLPKGAAKRFEHQELHDNNNIWKNKKYSVLTVKINKVNKIQQMPFIAHKGEGSINYTNTPPDEPIVIDSITLEDYINFHEIEYEILDGVYWDMGVNKKMGEVIQTLFNARLQAKKEKKGALSNVIKLMLNSSYGKTIMKKTNTENVIVKTTNKSYNEKTKKWTTHQKTDFEKYVYNNFNTIKSYRKINTDNYEVERVCADNSYNRGHIGCAILSMSKRIMNEVFDIANENEYPIYYTDTDSLHCNMDDVPKLEANYELKYNKKLNGTALEQFHTDFALDGACGEIYATKSIFLGKKSYMDVLESVDKNGNKISGTHIRLKGITEAGLEHTSKDYKDGYFGLYQDLAKGTKKKIILNPFDKDKNKNKVLFEFKQGRVSTRKEFAREVSF